MTSNDDVLIIIKKHLLAFDIDEAVSPAILAGSVMREIDQDKVSPPLVAFCSNMQLRQFARQVLRREYDQEDSPQSDMFNGLQDRYPGTGQHKGTYIPRLQMDAEDRYWNIHRLEKEATAKQQHADALRSETEQLIRDGVIAPLIESA